MKKTVLILAALLLCGCRKPVQEIIEPEETPPPSPVPVETKTVTLETEDHTVIFEIPAAFTYEEINADQALEILVKDGDREIVTVGAGLFGVCGTGLEEKKTVINDYEVTVGYYDGKDIWSFAVFRTEKPSVYVINCIYEGDHTEADIILESIVIER